MAVSLDELIVEQRESLVDGIVKDAIRQIAAYDRAPLRQTVERVERFLDALVESVARNDPDVLERYLVGVAQERKREGYAIMELHAIVHLAEEHLQVAIQSNVTDEVERNGLLALLDAVMGAARMVLSVRYLLSAQQL
jgi:AcrR family transcriptional regulator